jgi:hypothetical protein
MAFTYDWGVHNTFRVKEEKNSIHLRKHQDNIKRKKKKNSKKVVSNMWS